MPILDVESQQKAPSQDDLLKRARTDGSVNVPAAVFEQMFLAPRTEVKGELRQTFANPTAISIGGFLLCTTPLSMSLLGWQGADRLGIATVGSYFWIGGLLLILGSIGEWIIGNTFPATVFATFGGFFLTFGATLVPSYNAYGAYGLDPSNVAADITSVRMFHSTFAFFLVAMTLLATVYCIASVRTNIAFFLIFLSLIPCFATLAASYFAYGHGHAASAAMLQNVGAGLLLAVSFIGWYIFAALVLLSVDFPFMLPLGDLSTRFKGYAEKQKLQKGE
ncbi:hypothetical protein OHC33_011013 [Knufia fluminis]|uniref:GPR1/FUN34/YaaH-class plasma membrane protein n=1 Tax=Knufia fluminis TaxID=191047 RepID=A0AAN8I136_9EURO|nr:hypothetical protein OHC33_011013 [Knufia fluminis]